MGQLQKDIQAIVDVTWSVDGGALGFVEGDYGDDVAVLIHCAQPKIVEGDLKGTFSDCDEDARIAIAYVVKEHGEPGGAWAQAARDFCDDDIAGVFVIEKECVVNGLEDSYYTDLVCNKMDSKWGDFEDIVSDPLKYFPDSFWEAGLPILLDETGELSRFAVFSEKLDLDPRLRFADPDNVDDLKIPYLGDWDRFDRAPFPIFDASKTDLGRDMEKVVGLELLNAMDEKCRRELDWIVQRKTYNSDFCPEGIFELASFMNAVLPGSADEEILWTYGNWETKQSNLPRYAIGLDLSKTSLEEVAEAARHLFQVCVLAKQALYSHRLGFFPSSNMDETIEHFHEVMVLLGVDHQVEALNNGVPIEDVLA